MLEGFNPVRYAVIEEKNKREIVMLRGSGCRWGRCRFCDYHLDNDANSELNFELNSKELYKVSGIYQKLEVINSGSFGDLDSKTMDLIAKTAVEKNIKEVHFECHWLFRDEVHALKERFKNLGINTVFKIGVETFDNLFRESYLDKGMNITSVEEISCIFDECCLLFGIPGQSLDSMKNDIEIGLKFFKRVCVNIMQENGMPIKPDNKVIDTFINHIYPIYINDDRVDILLDNNAFGVGGVTTQGETND